MKNVKTTFYLLAVLLGSPISSFAVEPNPLMKKVIDKFQKRNGKENGLIRAHAESIDALTHNSIHGGSFAPFDSSFSFAWMWQPDGGVITVFNGSKYSFNKSEGKQMKTEFNPSIIIAHLRKNQPNVLQEKRRRILNSRRTLNRSFRKTMVVATIATLKVTKSPLWATLGTVCGAFIAISTNLYKEGYWWKNKTLTTKEKTLTVHEYDEELLKELQRQSREIEYLPLRELARILASDLQDHLNIQKGEIINLIETEVGLFIPRDVSNLTSQWVNSLNAGHVTCYS